MNRPVAELIGGCIDRGGIQRRYVCWTAAPALGQLEEKTYSLVICDLKDALCGRARPFYRELVHREDPMQHRVLFVTGDTMGPRTMEFLKSSGLPYLAKPFLVEELKRGRTPGSGRRSGGPRNGLRSGAGRVPLPGEQ